MDSEAFAATLSDWLTQEEGHLPGVLALDGKMIRDIIGTVTLANVEDGSPRAMAIMDQKKGTERCELISAQKLLDAQPCLEGITVTTDPLHCQKQTARIIAEKGGTRLHHSTALANLALIRNLNLHVIARQSWDGWLPEHLERLAANPAETLAILKAC
ncbi:MAG: hypothetical protein HOH33_16945 [Verrucomicrobia bacterium]|jgi:hypothetical protein|nr:hypothetical protein [Verrucomicrobiota bacterium]